NGNCGKMGRMSILGRESAQSVSTKSTPQYNRLSLRERKFMGAESNRNEIRSKAPPCRTKQKKSDNEAVQYLPTCAFINFLIALKAKIGDYPSGCTRKSNLNHHSNSSSTIPMKTQRVVIVALSILVVVLAYLAFSKRNKPEEPTPAVTSTAPARGNDL